MTQEQIEQEFKNEEQFDEEQPKSFLSFGKQDLPDTFYAPSITLAFRFSYI